MRKTGANLDRERRGQILDAALQCFLQFGYPKTSMDDVARKAGLSRPLIYLKFKSKQDLLSGLYVDFMEDALRESENILKSALSTQEKLAKISETISVRSWEKIVGHPTTMEFYDLCQKQFPPQSEKFKRHRARIYQELLGGSRELAETFLLAIHGFFADSPSVKVLRDRIHLLIDRFLRPSP
jgi:AcrR family transcriptional regulator